MEQKTPHELVRMERHYLVSFGAAGATVIPVKVIPTSVNEISRELEIPRRWILGDSRPAQPGCCEGRLRVGNPILAVKWCQEGGRGVAIDETS